MGSLREAALELSACGAAGQQEEQEPKKKQDGQAEEQENQGNHNQEEHEEQEQHPDDKGEPSPTLNDETPTSLRSLPDNNVTPSDDNDDDAKHHEGDAGETRSDRDRDLDLPKREQAMDDNAEKPKRSKDGIDKKDHDINGTNSSTSNNDDDDDDEDDINDNGDTTTTSNNNEGDNNNNNNHSNTGPSSDAIESTEAGNNTRNTPSLSSSVSAPHNGSAPASDYVIAIPTYQRWHPVSHLTKKRRFKASHEPFVLAHTLALLERQHIAIEKVHLFVADEAEAAAYRGALRGSAWEQVSILISEPGIRASRNCICSFFPEGTHVVSLDDDLEEIAWKFQEGDGATALAPLPPGGLEKLIHDAYHQMLSRRAFLWGLNTSQNPRCMRTEGISIRNGLVNGYFHGFRSRPQCVELHRTIADAMEDAEYSVRVFQKDRIVLRYKLYAAVTNPYVNRGGIQSRCDREFDGQKRKEEEMRGALRLHQLFPRLVARPAEESRGGRQSNSEVKFIKCVPQLWFKQRRNVPLRPKRRQLSTKPSGSSNNNNNNSNIARGVSAVSSTTTLTPSSIPSFFGRAPASDSDAQTAAGAAEAAEAALGPSLTAAPARTPAPVRGLELVAASESDIVCWRVNTSSSKECLENRENRPEEVDRGSRVGEPEEDTQEEDDEGEEHEEEDVFTEGKAPEEEGVGEEEDGEEEEEEKQEEIRDQQDEANAPRRCFRPTKLGLVRTRTRILVKSTRPHREQAKPLASIGKRANARGGVRKAAKGRRIRSTKSQKEGASASPLTAKTVTKAHAAVVVLENATAFEAGASTALTAALAAEGHKEELEGHDEEGPSPSSSKRLAKTVKKVTRAQQVEMEQSDSFQKKATRKETSAKMKATTKTRKAKANRMAAKLEEEKRSEGEEEAETAYSTPEKAVEPRPKKRRNLLRLPAFDEGDLLAWRQENPKLKGTDAHNLYEQYKSATTVSEAKASGCRNIDLSHDWARGFFRLAQLASGKAETEIVINVSDLLGGDTPTKGAEKVAGAKTVVMVQLLDTHMPGAGVPEQALRRLVEKLLRLKAVEYTGENGSFAGVSVASFRALLRAAETGALTLRRRDQEALSAALQSLGASEDLQERLAQRAVGRKSARQRPQELGSEADGEEDLGQKERRKEEGEGEEQARATAPISKKNGTTTPTPSKRRKVSSAFTGGSS